MVKIPTNDDLLNLAAVEDMARASIGRAVIELIRSGDAVSRSNIVGLLEAQAAASDVLAKGALRFISTLPPETP